MSNSPHPSSEILNGGFLKAVVILRVSDISSAFPMVSGNIAFLESFKPRRAAQFVKKEYTPSVGGMIENNVL